MKRNRLLLLLALLMTAATGAWADEVEQSESFTTNTSASVYTGEHFKITPDSPGGGDGIYLSENNNATIEALNGEIITKVEFTEGWYSINNFYCEVGTTTFSGVVATVSGVNQTSLSFKATATLQIKAVKVYYTEGPAEPSTYTVSMKSGVKDADKWTVKVGEGEAQALPIGGLNEGDAVTLQYNGRLKVKGVKATSDAGAPAAPAGNIANPVVGQIIGSDGKNYDANATLPSGVTKVAKICYVGSETGEAAPYNHGLALALSDANDGDPCAWNTPNTDAGHTKQASYIFTEESGLQYNDTHNSDAYPAFKAAIANNDTAAPTGCSSWFLPSGYQWKKMIDAAGLDNLGLTWGGYYWSSSENDASHAWDLDSYEGIWYNSEKGYNDQVRACLAF